MKNTYLPINWTDGVKLTKDHFINNYFNSVATVNDYTNVRLNNYNYGIVDEATDTSFEMETKANNSNLEVALKKCNCIAKNGHLIVFNKYLGAKWDWKEGNIFNLESEAVGALTWVHYDVREFSSIYHDDKYFVKTLADLNGKSIVSLANELGFEKTCICFGGGNKSEPNVNKPVVAGSCEDKFKKVAPIILKHEGGYVNDPDDSGGETNKGITIGTFKQYAKEDLGIEPTSENLKKITDDQATIIYRKRYWEPKGFCKIEDDKVSLMIYDWTITSGGAAKKVQELLIDEFDKKITADGGIGSKTIEAINSVEDQDKLLKRIGAIRKEYYTNLAIKDGKHTKNYKFLDGWHNRVDDCLNIKL